MGTSFPVVRVVRALAAAVALVSCAGIANAGPYSARRCAGVDYNAMVLDIIAGLPTGGGYSIGSDFVAPTLQAHNVGNGRWELRVYDGHPSHCTSATYALFAHLVATLQNDGRINLTPDQLRTLDARQRAADGTQLVDGQGLFGIFNSNGAGAAALFKHTGVGMSFRDDKLAYARPGDFLKMFWNDNVGASESGHQVVYLGQRQVDGRDMICFWGSQHQRVKKRGGRKEQLYFPAKAGAKVSNGYGQACRPRTDIKDMIFSRITCMEHLSAGLDTMQAQANAAASGPIGVSRPFVDEFLYSLRRKSSDQATLDRKYDITTVSPSLANLAAAPR
ncbi:hypothetical protein [Hyphomicrobium sp. NDB2Meth4]|uniref:hypothetical protein n=1 Tax=Hyphomicrobium sp. NDB2Meth4 TaxID=1892846 RepID=UPI0009319817|nr:hypothetical protein [Hyphomicrobium sp. NDB2Meth4]